MSSSKVDSEIIETVKEIVKKSIEEQNVTGRRIRPVTLPLDQEVLVDKKSDGIKGVVNVSSNVYSSEVDPITNLRAQSTLEKIKINNRRKKQELLIRNNKNLYSLPKYKISASTFTYQTDEEVRAASVVAVKSLLRESGLTDGIFDDRMGTIDKDVVCVTCKRDDRGCRGHPGHIDLPPGVTFVKHTAQDKCIQSLECICEYCGDTFITEEISEVLGISGMGDEQKLAICAKLSRTLLYKLHDHKLPHAVYNSSFTGYKLFFTVKTPDGKQKQYERSPANMLKIWNACPPASLKLIGFNGATHPRQFLFSCIPVIPPCLRPPVFIAKKQTDNMFTTCYIQILNRISQLQQYVTTKVERENALNNLYNDIKMIIYGPEKKIGTKVPLKESGVLGGLKTKKGLVRSNFMGKRVNYCGRAVAGPAYEGHPGETIIPKSFAEIIYMQDIISYVSYDRMYARFKNGDYKFFKMKLLNENGFFPVTAKHIAFYKPEIGDIFLRKLESGDMNQTGRQPSLHGPSILSYTSVIGETEQLKIISADNSCKNADFDGDEFTAHFPQTVKGQAEAMAQHNFKNNLMNAESNRPMIALAFHGLIGWFLATANWGRGLIEIPEKRFNEAIRLVSDSYRKKTLFDRIERVNKYTGKNIGRYTGNSLFSLCLPTNFTYTGSGLKIIDGILVEGTLCDINIGLKVNSLIQVLCKMYSQEEACRFLNDAQFLADWFTMWHGLSIGYKDFNANRKEVLKMLKKELNKMQIEFYNLGARPKDPINLHFWLQSAQVLLDKTKILGREIGSRYINKNNGLNILSKEGGSGAKGGPVNTSQITGSLGAQFVGSGIIEYDLKNKTRAAAFFTSNDVAVESIGYIVNSYMDGITLSAAIFHNIASRISLMDTAKSTADVGYTHRRIVKSLETIIVNWFGMVTSTDDRMFALMFNCFFNVAKMMPVKNKRIGEKIFFANFKAESELLNRIYERKHLKGNKGVYVKTDPIDDFTSTYKRRPRLSEMKNMGITCE